MEAEASSFETSEMLAAFLASTPLLSETWKLCSVANAAAAHKFVVSRTDGLDVAYVAFSGVINPNGADGIAGWDPSSRSMVALNTARDGLFSAFNRHGDEAAEEEPAMVHAGMLHLFLSVLDNTNFQTQILDMMKESKSVVFTGHSIGGTIASLASLWLLSYLQSTSPSSLAVLCITFGSPLMGNESLSKAILQERWGGSFCHVVAKHDIVPRLLLAAPLSPLTPQLHSLLQYWHFYMSSSPYLLAPAVQSLPGEGMNELFLFALGCVEASAVRGGGRGNTFWPFGSYLFCTNEGAVCLDNGAAVVKMMHLLLATGSASTSIDDHLKYGEYVAKVSSQILKRRGFLEGESVESNYEAGVALALQASQIASHEPVSGPAKDCLWTAKRMGCTPNLNSANLAIALSKITPLRAQIEWYKASCDESDDKLGYYDTFKLMGASRRDVKVNMNRIKLAKFWDDLLWRLDTNQLPHDFHTRLKWVNASHFYKLLVEPLDIAEYYRTGKHRTKGQYLKHGRERRYEIFDRWWRNREVGDEENNKRSRYASLTQDSCFWARVEEAREWLENVRSERDTRKLSLLWQNIEKFDQYARRIVAIKEVSADVLAENSSYSLWKKEWRELKLQMQQFPLCEFPVFSERKVVP